MSGAICTMSTNAMVGHMATVPMTTVTDTRRACGRSVSGTNVYVWSTGNTSIPASAIAAIPVFADTKLHARRPKEASQ